MNAGPHRPRRFHSTHHSQVKEKTFFPRNRLQTTHGTRNEHRNKCENRNGLASHDVAHTNRVLIHFSLILAHYRIANHFLSSLHGACVGSTFYPCDTTHTLMEYGSFNFQCHCEFSLFGVMFRATTQSHFQQCVNSLTKVPQLPFRCKRRRMQAMRW